MRPRHTSLTALTAAASAVFTLGLTACGGGGAGGNLPDAVPSAVTTTTKIAEATIKAGTSTLISGQAVSQPNAMSSMTWSVTKISGNGADLALSNGDCSASTRNSNSANGITRSTWSCDAVVTAPAAVSTDATYRVIFNGKDEKGNASTAYSDLTVQAASSNPSGSLPVANTQGALTLTSGSDASVACTGSGGTLNAGNNYVFSWVVKSNPSALPLSLNANGNSASFKAPAVSSPTTVTLQCRVTDDGLKTGVADSVITINPLASQSAIAVAGATQTAAAGATVSLDGSASTGPAGAKLNYVWQQIEGPTVSLSDATAPRPTFIAPTVTATTRLTFQLVATTASPADPATAAASEKTTQVVYVSATQPLTLAITGATVVKSNISVVLSVVGSPANGPLYYGWTQVSGPTVTLGGANTASASFISPTVSGSAVDMLFAVKVSRVPLDRAQPAEIYSTDVAVRTTP